MKQNEFKLWDVKENEFLKNQGGFDLSFPTVELADKHKDNYLNAGNYPDNPHDVIKVLQYNSGKFIKAIPY